MSSKPEPTTAIYSDPSIAMDNITDEAPPPRPSTLFSLIYPHWEPGLKLAFAAAAFTWAVRDYLASEKANRLAGIANQLALVSVCLANAGNNVLPNTCTTYLAAFNDNFPKMAESIAAQDGPVLEFTLQGAKAPKAVLWILPEMAIVLLSVLLGYVLFKVALEMWGQRRAAREGGRRRGM